MIMWRVSCGLNSAAHFSYTERVRPALLLVNLVPKLFCKLQSQPSSHNTSWYFCFPSPSQTKSSFPWISSLSYELKAVGETQGSSPQSEKKKNSQPFCSSHFADSPPANEAEWVDGGGGGEGGCLKTYKSFMIYNGIFTLPAHTSASAEQTGPAPSRSGLKTTASIWCTSNTQSLPGPRAVVAPMNYRNDLIVFSFGNTGGPPRRVSVFNGLRFPTGHMIHCYLPPTRVCWIRGGLSCQNRAGAGAEV